MRVSSLALTNFRNYTQLDLEFPDGLTILTGKNAQGKTNILEAIFLLSVAKSHRTNHDLDMVKWGADYARVSGNIERQNISYPLEMVINKKGKRAKFNYIDQAKLSHFIGKLNVILFAPEDLELVKGSPSIRRRFLDTEIGQAYPLYLSNLLEYNRLLRQRNSYLKDYGLEARFDQVYYDILTDQLIELADQLIQERLKFTRKLEDLSRVIHSQLSDHQDELSFTYQPSSTRLDYSLIEEIPDQLQILFNQSIDREKRQGYTLYGPHRDDLVIYLNGKEADYFASQGQQRTIVLAMKLAELELMEEVMGEYPVLLLDDVLSELDLQRQFLLMDLIDDKVQTFLTTTSIDSLAIDQLQEAQVLHVNQGQVTDS